METTPAAEVKACGSCSKCAAAVWESAILDGQSIVLGGCSANQLGLGAPVLPSMPFLEAAAQPGASHCPQAEHLCGSILMGA